MYVFVLCISRDERSDQFLGIRDSGDSSNGARRHRRGRENVSRRVKIL